MTSISLEELMKKDTEGKTIYWEGNNHKRFCENVIVTYSSISDNFNIYGYAFRVWDNEGEWIKWSEEENLNLKEVMTTLYKMR